VSGTCLERADPLEQVLGLALDQVVNYLVHPPARRPGANDVNITCDLVLVLLDCWRFEWWESFILFWTRVPIGRQCCAMCANNICIFAEFFILLQGAETFWKPGEVNLARYFGANMLDRSGY
jgi:hypothetical protein